jgi:hypothetical protein
MSSNEMLYKFKITKFWNLLTNSIILKKINDENSLTFLEKKRVIIRKEVEKVIIFANVAMKIRYDLTRKLLKMNVKNVVYLKLHKKYTQSDLFNRKFSKQQFELIKIIEKINKLAYKLEISQSWKIHSVISITYFESTSHDSDLYEKESNESKSTKNA